MAATYVNNVRYYEDGYGDVHLRFVVSDSYAGLFLPDSDAGTTQVGCIEIDSIKKGMQNGAQANDEVQFSINAASLVGEEDNECLEFILSAQDIETKIYIAVFIEPSTTPTNTEIDFIGVIDPQQEATDVRWYGDQYGTDVTPLRNWKFSARPYQIEFFDGYEIENLVKDVDDGIMATGSTWYSSHVADRQAYFHDVFEGTIRDVKFTELVNLNDVLIKLTSIVQGRIRTQLSEPTFTISIEGATSPFTMTPVRWKSLKYLGVVTRYVQSFKLNSNDQRTVKIGTSVSEAESPWVHWNVFFPPDGAKELSAWNRGKTYTNFLYQVAYCFGFHLTFEYTTTTELTIKFTPLSEFVRSNIYPADVKDATLKVTPIKGDSSSIARPRNQSSVYSLEGSDYYSLSQPKWTDSGSPIASYRISRAQITSNALLLSISPTLRVQAYGEDSGETLRTGYFLTEYYEVYLPHNAVFYDNGSIKHQLNPDSYKDSAYRANYPVESHIHNGIYLKVTGATSGMHDYGVNGTSIWTPVGYAHIDGKSFDKLCDAVNYLNGVESDARYETRYTLTVPFICRYSATSTSPHDSWKNLGIGNTLTLDGVDYSVTSFERIIRNRTTKIEMYRASKFSFAESTGLALPVVIEGGAGTPIIGSSGSGSSGGYVFDTDAVTGDAMVMLDNGHLAKMQATNMHYGRFIGCSTSDVAAGDNGDVATAGELLRSAKYSFEKGQQVYLRTSGSADSNVRPKSEELSFPHRGQDLHFSVGYAMDVDVIKIFPSEQWLFRT